MKKPDAVSLLVAAISGAAILSLLNYSANSAGQNLALTDAAWEGAFVGIGVQIVLRISGVS